VRLRAVLVANSRQFRVRLALFGRNRSENWDRLAVRRADNISLPNPKMGLFGRCDDAKSASFHPSGASFRRSTELSRNTRRNEPQTNHRGSKSDQFAELVPPRGLRISNCMISRPLRDIMKRETAVPTFSPEVACDDDARGRLRFEAHQRLPGR
jgi:hypothetical protein